MWRNSQPVIRAERRAVKESKAGSAEEIEVPDRDIDAAVHCYPSVVRWLIALHEYINDLGQIISNVTSCT